MFQQLNWSMNFGRAMPTTWSIVNTLWSDNFIGFGFGFLQKLNLPQLFAAGTTQFTFVFFGKPQFKLMKWMRE